MREFKGWARDAVAEPETPPERHQAVHPVRPWGPAISMERVWEEEREARFRAWIYEDRCFLSYWYHELTDPIPKWVGWAIYGAGVLLLGFFLGRML